MTLVNGSTGEVRRLTKKGFYVAGCCDGQIDFDSLAFLPQHIALLDELIADGIAEPCRLGDSIQAWQRYRRADNPRLFAIHWCITGFCNLNCRHCCMESPSRRFGELPFAKMARLIGQFQQANVVQVCLSGGEPFFRKDILDLIALLARKRLLLNQIYTNGVLITGEHLQGISRLGFTPSFQISYDGLGTHDQMRGTRGIEQRTIDAIRRVRNAGFPVIVSTSIDRINMGRLKGTYQLMKALAIQSWRISSPQMAGNWRGTATAISLAEEAEAYEPLLLQWRRDGEPFLLQLGGFFRSRLLATNRTPLQLPRARAPATEFPRTGKPAPVGDAGLNYTPESFDCASCREQLTLLPDGTLIPCPAYTDTHIRDRMPNLLRGNLSTVWRKSFLRDIAEMKKKDLLTWNPECVGCEHFRDCGLGCRAAAVTETGDLMSKDPLSCKVYRLGYKKRFQDLGGSRR